MPTSSERSPLVVMMGSARRNVDVDAGRFNANCRTIGVCKLLEALRSQQQLGAHAGLEQTDRAGLNTKPLVRCRRRVEWKIVERRNLVRVKSTHLRDRIPWALRALRQGHRSAGSRIREHGRRQRAVVEHHTQHAGRSQRVVHCQTAFPIRQRAAADRFLKQLCAGSEQRRETWSRSTCTQMVRDSTEET